MGNFLVYKIFFIFLIFSIILNCKGNNTIHDLSLYDICSNKDSGLEVITIDETTLKISKSSGTLIRNGISNTVRINNKIYSNVIPNKDLTSYVTIIPQGNSINNSFGILGLENKQFIIPVGKHTYKGNSEVFINDGNALYGLSGSSKIIFDYDGTNAFISGEIKSLSGKKSFLNLSCRDCSASNVVDIFFPIGKICEDNRVCFSEIELRNSKLDTGLTDSYTLTSDGSFFGPNGEEFGNIFSVNDTKDGSIEIRGATINKK